ncbi:transmembrane protein, putative [Medicago truncatula]|uniref:Transmembrane protein, putative n=1 Tax=Medicago truncatula TaxID=3880 RepID=G7LHJ7_MEDTR|nr:transmembrane protein, putative [Medicago truncatula]
MKETSTNTLKNLRTAAVFSSAAVPAVLCFCDRRPGVFFCRVPAGFLVSATAAVAFFTPWCGCVHPLSKIHWATCYQVSAIRPPTVYVHEPSECVKSPTSDTTWPDNVFISGGNHHLANRFCGVVLGSTTISKKDERSMIDNKV